MASGLASGTALRHLRDLFHDGTAVGLSDGQLLARYAADRDGPPSRPWSRATARWSWPPAAPSSSTSTTSRTPSRPPSSSWPGRPARSAPATPWAAGCTASPIAPRCRRTSRRSGGAGDEAETSAMAIPAATRPGLDAATSCDRARGARPAARSPSAAGGPLRPGGPDLRAGRRAPRWTEPTLRHRLVKARERLRERLTRRGITAGSVGRRPGRVRGTAAVPAALGSAGSRRRPAGPVGDGRRALSATIIRSLTMTKLKIAAAAVLAAATLATAGVVAIGAGRPDEPGPAMKRSRQPRCSGRRSPANPEYRRRTRGDDRGPWPGRRSARAGRSRGRPSGRLPRSTGRSSRRPRPRAGRTAGSSCGCRPGGANSVLRRRDAIFPWIIALAPGFGPGWAVGRPRARRTRTRLTIRLVADGPPIEGRIVDLEGRPVAGARVKVEHLVRPGRRPWPDWLDRRRGPRRPRSLAGPRLRCRRRPTRHHRPRRPLPPDGHRPRPDRRDPRLRPDDRHGPALRPGPRRADGLHDRYPIDDARDQPERSTTPGGSNSPRRRQADRGHRPRQGHRPAHRRGQLRGMVFDEHSLVSAPGVEAKTDAQGHYRLAGLPKAPAYRLFVEPGEGRPYPKATFRVPAESPALEPRALRLRAQAGHPGPRQGDRQGDRPAGLGLRQCVSPSRTIPTSTSSPAIEASLRLPPSIKDDGRYEVVALPGRGIIACRSDTRPLSRRRRRRGDQGI